MHGNCFLNLVSLMITLLQYNEVTDRKNSIADVQNGGHILMKSGKKLQVANLQNTN